MEPNNVSYYEESKSTSSTVGANIVSRGDTVFGREKVIPLNSIDSISVYPSLKCSRKWCRVTHKPFLDPCTARFLDPMVA